MSKKIYERPSIKPIMATMPGKSGTDISMHVQSDIDGVPLPLLAEKYGSPLFIFSETVLRKNLQQAKQAFSTRYPQVCFAWSYKTNYLNAICEIFHQENSWAEVVSDFEYEKALNNGVPGNKIIFNGPNKSENDLKKAVLNDSLIHIDNMEELCILTELARSLDRKPKVAIRVNMETGVFPFWDRFGFNLENGRAWHAITKIISDNLLELKGLHCHIGTFILSVRAYKTAAEKMAALACEIQKKYQIAIDYIDMGGGFASKNSLKTSYLNGEDICPSIDEYAEAITTAFLQAPFGSRKPLLILETGRALVDDAGYLLTTVLSNKRSSDGRLNVTIDAGVNFLFTSFWYNHKVSTVRPYSNYTEDVTLCGPLCMNIDIIREHVSLPLLKRGDLLLIHYVGAYNVTQWMQFISMRPKILMINRKGEVEVIRESENFEYVTSLENKCKKN